MEVSEVLSDALPPAKRASGWSQINAQSIASPPMVVESCALMRSAKDGHLTVPEMAGTSMFRPPPAIWSRIRTRPFSIVMSPKGVSSPVVVSVRLSQCGRFQLTVPSAARSMVTTGSTNRISSSTGSPRRAASKLKDAVMRPTWASRRGFGSFDSMVAEGRVISGSGQNRTSGSPPILLLPPDQASSIRSIVARASVVEMTSGSAAL